MTLQPWVETTEFAFLLLLIIPAVIIFVALFYKHWRDNP